MHRQMEALKAEVVDGETQQAAEVNPQGEQHEQLTEKLSIQNLPDVGPIHEICPSVRTLAPPSICSRPIIKFASETAE